MLDDRLALALAVIFKSCGDALLGRALTEKRALSPWQALREILRNRRLFLGVLVTAVHFCLYAYCLQRIPVTLANPMTASTILIGSLYAQWGLGERVNRRRWTGILLVTTGATLVGLSG